MEDEQILSTLEKTNRVMGQRNTFLKQMEFINSQIMDSVNLIMLTGKGDSAYISPISYKEFFERLKVLTEENISKLQHIIDESSNPLINPKIHIEVPK